MAETPVGSMTSPWVPGATGTTRIMDKGYAFEDWLKREVARSATRNLDFVRDLIAKGGEDAAAAWLAKLPDWERDKAAKVGSQVHDLADRITKGEKPSVPTELVPFVQADLRFRRDHKISKARSEVVLYSHQGYGATLDELCVLDGQVSIIERKTGRNVYEDLCRMQLAAQARADLYGPGIERTADHRYRLVDPKRTRPMPTIARTYVLHLRPDKYADGYRLIEYHLTDDDYEAFLACLRLTNWRVGLNGKGI